jgi:MFS family permease
VSRHPSNFLVFGLGVLATMAMLWIAPRLFRVIIDFATNPESTAWNWIVSLAQFVRAVLNFLPGLLVGYLCTARGIRIAFAAGLLGAVAYPFLLSLLPSYGAMHDPLYLFTWSSHFGYCLTLAVNAAAGSALGILLRSNKSLERTREE